MTPAVITFLTEAMNLVPLLIKAGEDIAPFAETVYNIISTGADPTDADWATLKGMETSLRTTLQAPI